MQIYISRIAEDWHKDPVALHVSHETFTVTEKGKTFTFDIQAVEFAPDILNVGMNQFSELVVSWVSEVMNNRDGLAAQVTRKKINDFRQRNTATIAIAADRSWCAYINQPCVVTYDEGVSPVEVVGFLRGNDVLEARFPAIRPFLAHNRAKQKALAKVNTQDNLVALEIQVDMLMETLAAVVNGEPAPEWFMSLITATSPYTADKEYPGTVVDRIALIAEEKAKTRMIQREYFADLAAIYG